MSSPESQLSNVGQSSLNIATYFLFAIRETLQLPGSLHPLHLHPESVGGQTLPVLVVLHLPPEVLDGPGEAEVGVLSGACVAPGCRLYGWLLDLATDTPLGSSVQE